MKFKDNANIRQEIADVFAEGQEPVRIDGLATDEKNMLITCSLIGGAVSDAGPGSIIVKKFTLGTCEKIRGLYAIVRKYLNEKYPEIKTECTGVEFGFLRDAGGDDFVEFKAEGYSGKNTYSNKFRAYISAFGEIRDTLAGEVGLDNILKIFKNTFPGAVVCDIEMSDFADSVVEVVLAGNFNGMSVSDIIQKTKNILVPDKISLPKTGITVLSSPDYDETSTGDADEYTRIYSDTQRINCQKKEKTPINLKPGESILFEFYISEEGKVDIYYS